MKLRIALVWFVPLLPVTSAVAQKEGAGAPEEVASEVEPTATVGYDKGFVLRSADDQFALKAGLRSQTRLEVTKDEGSEWQSAFLIARLRLQFEGHAFGEDNSYKLELEPGAKGNVQLKDFYLNRVLAPNFQARAGQWKRPFSRHEIVSDFASAFLERSIANSFSPAGRDVGVALHNGYEKSPDGLEWAVGLFNGTGERGTQRLTCPDPADASSCTISPPSNVPSDFDPAFVARVGWNMGGIKGYSEGDLEGGAPRLAVGASYYVNLNRFVKDADGDLILTQSLEVDAVLKVRGFDLQGAVYLLKEGGAGAEFAFFGQGGYFVVPEEALVAARASAVPDPLDPDRRLIEALAGFDWFWSGHNFKWMTDAGILNSGAAETTGIQVRSQVQLVF
jgi:hypothetical protein